MAQNKDKDREFTGMPLSPGKQLKEGANLSFARE